jgi:hypothetical protein
MTISKRKIVAISTSLAKVRAKQRASVHFEKKPGAETYEAPQTGCPDPGPAGFDFSEDDAGRAMQRPKTARGRDGARGLRE